MVIGMNQSHAARSGTAGARTGHGEKPCARQRGPVPGIGTHHAAALPLDTGRQHGYLGPSRHRGGVAKWPKATVCKTVIRGFESRLRLQRSAIRGEAALIFGDGGVLAGGGGGMRTRGG